MNGTHFGNERIAFGHVTDERSDLLCLIVDVVTEDASGTCRGLIKTKQRMNQRCLASSVRTKQTDRLATKIATEIL